MPWPNVLLHETRGLYYVLQPCIASASYSNFFAFFDKIYHNLCYSITIINIIKINHAIKCFKGDLLDIKDGKLKKIYCNFIPS
jgi:hypothetical protein